MFDISQSFVMVCFLIAVLKFVRQVFKFFFFVEIGHIIFFALHKSEIVIHRAVFNVGFVGIVRTRILKYCHLHIDWYQCRFQRKRERLQWLLLAL